MNKKPLNCCHPDCFNCPYIDCKYDRLEMNDYSETNDRDYELFKAETGKFLHKKTDRDYQNARSTAYQRKNRRYVDRSEYNRKYYQDKGDHIRTVLKAKYDTDTNTRRCRKYRNSHLEKMKQYDKEYYELNKVKKREQARLRYQKKKLEREGVVKCS